MKNKIVISDLLECPFCESNNLKQIAKVRFEDSKQVDSWYISCEDCNARGGEEKELEDAKARWNRDYEYFIKKDGSPNLFTVKFIAWAENVYPEYKGDTQYDFEAETLEDARHWVINHLDCSCEWNVREL